MTEPTRLPLRTRRRRSRALGRRIVTAAAVLVIAVTAVAAWRMNMPAPDVRVVAATAPELEALAGQRVFFGHQSVGANLVDGLRSMNENAGVDAVVAQTREPLAGLGFMHDLVGVNGDPRSKMADFAEIIDGAMGDAVDFALLKFCYLDVTADTDVDRVADEYTALLDDLAERHPDVVFLPVTVPLTRDRDWKGVLKSWVAQDAGMGPADNVARHEFNERLRERYAGTGRLFDIAAIEAGMPDSPTLRTHEGEEYYVLHEALSADPGHLNGRGAWAVASELARVVAGTVR